MNRLFQFLRKLLIAALAGVFISISMFPGKVTALTLAQAPSTSNGVSPPEEEINFLKLATGQATNTPTNTCPGDSGKPFQNPDFVSSKDGQLDITLTATYVEKGINFGAKDSFDGLLYNGTYTPPTLRVSPGDTINLTLNNNLPKVNQVSQDTNLHYHGFNVSPLLGSDDVVMHVHSSADGVSFPSTPDQSNPQYKMKVYIPKNHQTGLFWYHPHVHTTSERQVSGGMSGGIIVEKEHPQNPDQFEQVMLFKDFGNPNYPDFNCFTLNGLIQPVIKIEQQEKLWRIANIGADTYLNLALKDSQEQLIESAFTIHARDGNPVSEPFKQTTILLPPASRVDVTVDSTQLKEDKYKLVSVDIDYKSDGNPPKSVKTWYDLARVVKVVSVASLKPLKDDDLKNRLIQDSYLPDPETLAKDIIPNAHTFTFGNPQQGVFTINDQVYDENRIDTTVQVGDIEQWTLKNATKGHHAFHIHQLDFVDMANYKGPDKPSPMLGYQDTIDLPPCTGQSTKVKGVCDDPETFSETKVPIPFVNPVITGVFVYHCHILGHEDKGMMQNIKVINPPLATSVSDVLK